jgi:hypothetical protein
MARILLSEGRNEKQPMKQLRQMPRLSLTAGDIIAPCGGDPGSYRFRGVAPGAEIRTCLTASGSCGELEARPDGRSTEISKSRRKSLDATRSLALWIDTASAEPRRATNPGLPFVLKASDFPREELG